MAEKPKRAKPSNKTKGKGFYAAVYGGIAGLFVLAVAIGYYSLSSPYETGFEVGEIALPVSGTSDVPVANITQPTVPSVPTPTTPQREPLEDAMHGEPPQQTQPSEQPPQNQSYEPMENEVDVVYEPPFAEVLGPAFAYFTETDEMSWPVLGNVVMDFSDDRHVFDVTLDQWRTNHSISISAHSGDAVRAAAPGIVSQVGFDARQGTTVVIDHGNGWNTTYKQLGANAPVTVGDVVSRGQIVGHVDTPSIFTNGLGYHVGFSVQHEGQNINPHIVLTQH